MEISKKDMKVLLKSQQGEIDAVPMYNALAKVVRDPKDAEAFKQLAKEEGHHASVFHHLTQTVLQPRKTKAIFLPILYKVFGKKLVYSAISKAEYAAEKNYAPVADKFPTVQSVKADERRHGDIVKGLLN